jgi:hypothetical protein
MLWCVMLGLYVMVFVSPLSLYVVIRDQQPGLVGLLVLFLFCGAIEGLESVGMGLDCVRIGRKGLLIVRVCDWIPEKRKGLPEPYRGFKSHAARSL